MSDAAGPLRGSFESRFQTTSSSRKGRAVATVLAQSSLLVGLIARAEETPSTVPVNDLGPAWSPESHVERSPEKTETTGLALSAGVGSQYPIFGAQAAFYLQAPRGSFLGEWFRVAPYASAGYGMCRDKSMSECDFGAAFGAMTSWGRKHRFVLDAFYATVNSDRIWIHGEPLDNRVVWGIGLASGYEYMAFSGFFFRGELGFTYAFGPPIYSFASRLGFASSAGVGYKLW